MLAPGTVWGAWPVTESWAASLCDVLLSLAGHRAATCSVLPSEAWERGDLGGPKGGTRRELGGSGKGPRQDCPRGLWPVPSAGRTG